MNWLSNQVEYKQILTQLLIGLIDTLKENDREEIFLEEVTDDKVPGYSNVVKQPICLKTIENRVRKSVYVTLDEFKKDVRYFTGCYISIRLPLVCLIDSESFICR